MSALRLFHRRILQCAIAVGGTVPVVGGLSGVVYGPAMISDGVGFPTAMDSHWRYLSGLLLAIGLGFWSTIPDITRQGPRFRLLTGLVVIGGGARLVSLIVRGAPTSMMMFALAMELAVTPLLAVWQHQLADRSAQ